MKRMLQAVLVLAITGCGGAPSVPPGTPPVARVKVEGAVTTVDFLAGAGLDVNGLGPVLVTVDARRNRIIAANTLSSSMSFIDGSTHEVVNVPLAGRAFQHLKSESMTLNRSTGDVYLVGMGGFHIISPDARSARMIETGAQLESIAVDEATGNVFVVGRESRQIVFYDAGADEVKRIDWLESEERLLNVNQTPPPPIRKVVADGSLGRIVAVDGYTTTLHQFDARTGEHLESRPVELASGGRWHLAGYDEKNHRLFIVTETAKRQVIQAARIGVADGKDVVVELPEFTEGVGIVYNPARDEVYVPYDNHPSVHVVRFEAGGSIEEIQIPSFGNDASAIDLENDILYIGSWAMGEIDVVDLGTRKLARRIEGLGIIPHMFTMALNPVTNRIYFPKGASAVNGTFGAALTVVDPLTGETSKVYTGWAPVDLVEMKARGSVLVFNSEDAFAEVLADGTSTIHRLPYDYPVKAVHGPGGDVYLSYGPHQSYWPVVYIWGAKNGILTIDAEDLGFYDRRIYRQALDMVVDRDGALYFTQNNWGDEEQFVGVLADGVRELQPSMRLVLGDKVTREVTQRVLEYDAELHRLYLVRAGEKDEDPSVLTVVDLTTGQVAARVELGRGATDLAQDGEHVYVAGFTSNTVNVVRKDTFEVIREIAIETPLRLLSTGKTTWAISHTGGTLHDLASGAVTDIPYEARPDNLFEWDGAPVVTAHGPEASYVLRADAGKGIELVHEMAFPYGDTRFDTVNVSFYLTGQYGDAVLSLTESATAGDGRLWITDFLSGRLLIIAPGA